MQHGFSQTTKPINLNEKNGLPTNFVYDMVVDRYGYLWLGTPKGAIKYNGYETKIFDFSSGLPNEDVWSVFADTSGRIWCGSHTNRLGYIKNDKFHLIKNSGFNEGLYPRGIKNFKNGIAFIGDDVNEFFFEKDDTLYKKRIADSAYYTFINDSNQLLVYSAHQEILKIDNPDVDHKTHKVGNFRFPLVYNIARSSFGNDKILFFIPSDTLWIYKADTVVYRAFPYLFDAPIRPISFYTKQNLLFLVYDKGIVSLDKNYNIVNVFKFNREWQNGMTGYNTPAACIDKLWDTCFITNKHGFFNITSNKIRFREIADSLAEYKYINKLNRNEAVWWSATAHKGAIVSDGRIKAAFSLPTYDLKYALSLNDSCVFLFTSGISGFWYYPRQSKLVLRDSGFLGYTFSAAIDRNNHVYLQSPNILWEGSIDDGLKINLRDKISTERYKEIIYDSLYDMTIAYKYDEVAIMKGEKRYFIDAKQLNSIGLLNIECIRTDNRGNIFIKDNKKIVWLNMQRRIYKRLLSNADFADAKMDLIDDLLVVGGSFGFYFYKIGSDLSVRHCIYRNVKELHYSHIYNMQVNDKNVFFTSDEGSFITDIPGDNEFSEAEDNDLRYRLFIKYGGVTYSSHTIDTIRVSQDNLMIDFDVINPVGIGKLSYRYSIGEYWQAVTGTQLFLTGVTPGEYLKLTIIAKDKSWISGKNNFVVYVIPFWWQTDYGKTLISLGIIIFIALVAITVFLVTNTTIKKRNERNQLKMDIELKSIYSQINPHFIFNTLSGTQYFIRENQTQQARLHLNKFSRLLRSYIHSSRNKYITIKDELGNLINYIELQQIRFADKFDYKIVIADDLPVEAIKIPSLLLQPLVENAINHGLFHVEEYKGLLKIEFSLSKETDEIICIIDDNGIGRKKAKEIKADSIVKTESYGDALIKDLINIFNKYEKLNIKIEYTDKQPPQSGTTVTLKIKNPVYEKKD